MKNHCSLQSQNLHAAQLFSKLDSICNKIGTKPWLTPGKYVTIKNSSPVTVQFICT